MSRSFGELSPFDVPEVTTKEEEEEVEALSFRCAASSSSKLFKRQPTGISAEHADSHEEEINDSFDLGLEYVVNDTVSFVSNAPHQSVKKHHKKAVPFVSGSFLEPSMDPGLKDYPNDTDYKNDQVEYQAWLRRMEMRKRKKVS